MRLIRILRYYMSGIRLLAFTLSLLMLWAIICGVAAYGKVQNIKNDLNIITSANLENMYLLSYFFNLNLQGDESNTQMIIKTLEAEPAVDKVLSVSVATPVSYEGNPTSIVLYEPELLDTFPALKGYGIDFENCLDGCILASKLFNTLNTGDTIELTIAGKQASFPVAGHLQNPYHRLTLSVSSSSPRAEDLFTDGDAIIMQATPTVLAQLKKMARRIELDSNLIVVFNNNSTAEEQSAVLSNIASAYRCFHFNEIRTNTEQKVSETLKQELPQPVFLAIMAFVSFFSILILSFKKKSKSIAVLYLCGYSKKRCGLLAFAASQIFLLVPILLGALFVLIWPHIDWNFLVLPHASWTSTSPSLLGLKVLLESITINASCLWIILWYYLTTTLCAVTVTVVAVSKHTPVTYLREELR